jgi:hypothetical protein
MHDRVGPQLGLIANRSGERKLLERNRQEALRGGGRRQRGKCGLERSVEHDDAPRFAVGRRVGCLQPRHCFPGADPALLHRAEGGAIVEAALMHALVVRIAIGVFGAALHDRRDGQWLDRRQPRH